MRHLSIDILHRISVALYYYSTTAAAAAGYHYSWYDMTLTDESIALLENEFSILHLIYHRNKNQHRALVWWKYLNMIHRYIKKILSLYKTSKNDMTQLVNKFLNKKIMDKAYWEFNSIISLGQFVTLGLTLIGLLAKIWSILEPERKQAKSILHHQPTNNAKSTVNDLDLGEEIEPSISNSKLLKRESDISDIFGTSKKRKTGENTKKKKKKKQNDIDDIFG